MEEGFPPPLYPQWCVVREMLADRGYVVPHEVADYESTYCVKTPQGTIVLRDALAMLCQHAATRESIMVLFYAPPDSTGKVNVDVMRALVGRLTGDCKHLIIVTPAWSPLTPPAKAHVEEVNRGRDLRVELFTEDELATNLTRHSRVGRAPLRGRPNVKRVTSTYVAPPPYVARTPGAAGTHLPCVDAMLDPVARYHGLQREDAPMGDALSIERASETAGKYVTHRVPI